MFLEDCLMTKYDKDKNDNKNKDNNHKYDSNANIRYENVLEHFCKDCFVYDSCATSIIDIKKDYEIIGELFISYIEFMLETNEKNKFIKMLNQKWPVFDIKKMVDYKPKDSFIKNRLTLQYVRISPLIYKLHEIRKNMENKKKHD